jgi:outer membrane protein OmpA-like peptidoglycan-associated protein
MPARLLPLCIALVVTAPCLARDDAASLHIAVLPQTIVIEGGARSAAHEWLLRHAASLDPMSRPVQIATGRVDEMPAGWTLVSELAVRAAVLMEEGSAVVSRQSVRFEGISSEPQRLRAALDRLDAVMLPGMQKETRVIAVSARRDPFDVLCRRQFFALTRDNRIEFVRGGDSLREGAQPVLDRLVELMAECPMLEVTVTGHTDSVGEESLNRQISRARAESVVAYVVGRGIPADRLRSAGAGSGRPRESGGSPWARRLNRRVEFALADP